jgi:chaperonin GroES
MKPQETMTMIRPLGSRVLAKRLEQKEEIKKGGIILPDSAKTKQESAQVVAVGPGIETKNGQIVPVPVQIGDRILIDKYSGQEISLDDQEFVIVRSEDIIAIIG